MIPRTRNFILAVGVTLAGLITLVLVRRNGTTASAPATARPAASAAIGAHDMVGMTTGANGSVTLTAAQIRQFGVTFDAAAIRTLTSATRATGIVTVDETKLVQVTPRFGGFVERLYVNATGQPVRRGQPLLDVYSPELVAAQQELLVAGQLQRDIGRSTVPGVPATSSDLVAAARRRLQLLNISDAQIDDVLRTGRVRRALTLYAPGSGVVLEKKVVQGQAIQPGEQLYTIADLSGVWVDVELRETDAAAVRAGSGADIVVTGLPGRTLKGRVAYVYPTLDSASRAVRARVVVTNTDGLLKPGMYATATIVTPGRSVLAVPTTAVLRTGERNVVFVAMPNGTLMPHEVTLGNTAGEYVEILGGLEAGQRVVTSAQFLLDSESNLGDVMKSMLGQMSTATDARR